MNLHDLQVQVKTWGQKNFPSAEPWEPLVGAMEELGELSHAHLKRHQGIRGTDLEHRIKAEDAVADIVIFLAHYCSLNGHDFGDCVERIWHSVKQRDWTKNPKSGVDTLPI